MTASIEIRIDMYILLRLQLKGHINVANQNVFECIVSAVNLTCLRI